MEHFALFLVLGICLGVGGWQLAVWLGEIRDKNKKYKAASNYTMERNKPMLVIGGPWGNKQARHWLKMPAHGNGDVCLDIDRRAIGDHPNGVIADVTRIPFSDRSFGAIFASHLLEHLPTTDDAEKALAELSRVAEAVFIAYPSKKSIAGWVIPDHHLWVWQKGNTIYLKQRGKSEARTRRNVVVELAVERATQGNNLLKGEKVTEQLKMSDVDLALQEEARYLAEQLFDNDSEKVAKFTSRLQDIFTRAQNKDFLLIHNPGGWGTTHLEHCLQWERSIVEGIRATIERLGYTWLLIQHFRTEGGWREYIRDIKEQFHFFASKAKIIAAEVEFLTQHINNLKVILIGASQGAAFSNAVMQRLAELDQVYSIELGMIFTQKPRRVVTERTLTIDGNGLMPDAMMEWDIITIIKAFLAANFRWIKYWLQGRPRKFSLCVNVPGHEYNWEYPEVRHQIEDFLQNNLGTKSSLEEGLS